MHIKGEKSQMNKLPYQELSENKEQNNTSSIQCHLENKTKTLSNLFYKISITWIIQKLSIQNTEQKD